MNLASVVGQGRAIEALRAVLGSGRVPGAFLFHGRPGIGKFRAAVAFSRALLCEREGDDACEACRACRRSAQRIHPNLRIVAEGDDVRSIKIADVRALQAELALKPLEGRRKAVVIDNADRMPPTTANALLKTLEEPPPQSCIILVAASLDRILETIRSRCHRIRFRPLAPEDARRVLEGERSEPLEDEQAAFVTRLAGGSPGRALQLADASYVAERDALVDLFLSMGSGRGDPLEAATALQTLAVGAEKVDRAAVRVRVEGALELLEAFVADVLRELAGAGPERGIFASGHRTEALTRHGRDPDRWEFLLRRLLETAHNVRSNADVDLSVGDLFLAIDRRLGGGGVALRNALTTR